MQKGRQCLEECLQTAKKLEAVYGPISFVRIQKQIHDIEQLHEDVHDELRKKERALEMELSMLENYNNIYQVELGFNVLFHLQTCA
jgi:hypothetical protein